MAKREHHRTIEYPTVEGSWPVGGPLPAERIATAERTPTAERPRPAGRTRTLDRSQTEDRSQAAEGRSDGGRRASFGPPTVRHGPIGFYDDEDFLASAAVGFLLPALTTGSFAVAVMTGPHRAAVERELAAAGIDVTAARERGDYLPVDSEQLASELVVDGRVDLERFEAATGSLFDAAGGRPGDVRICGDLATVLWQAGESAAVVVLEQLWNELAEQSSFQLLCMYATSAIEEASIGDLGTTCALHSEIAPIERYSTLISPDVRRIEVLRESRDRSPGPDDGAAASRRRALEAELDTVTREAAEQQAQFRQAIASRDLIGQAKGIVMVRWRVDADTAFDMLRQASNRSGRKLHDVARDLVAHQLRRN